MKCARDKDLVPRDWKWNRFCYTAMQTLNLSCCLVSIPEEIPVTELAEKYAPILPWQHNKTEVLSPMETGRKRKKEIGMVERYRQLWSQRDHSLGSGIFRSLLLPSMDLFALLKCVVDSELHWLGVWVTRILPAEALWKEMKMHKHFAGALFLWMLVQEKFLIY